MIVGVSQNLVVRRVIFARKDDQILRIVREAGPVAVSPAESGQAEQGPSLGERRIRIGDVDGDGGQCLVRPTSTEMPLGARVSAAERMWSQSSSQ
jgi:hypothetical protein